MTNEFPHAENASGNDMGSQPKKVDELSLAELSEEEQGDASATN